MITTNKKKLSFDQLHIIFYLIPIVILGIYINSFSINLPVGDDWALVSFFNQIKSGNPNFNLFFSQHNEHRMFFPRIIFAVLAFLTNWNIKVELWFSFFLSIINFGLIYKISLKTFNKSSHFFIFANIFSSFMLFSLGQWENWLWGFQIAWFLIITCIISAIYVIYVPTYLSLNIRLFLASGCCLIASFSSAHGLLTWLALIPLIFSISEKLRWKIIRITIWLFLFSLSTIIYMMGYKKPSGIPTLSLLENPIIFSKYLMAIIGSPIHKLLNDSIFIGFVLSIIFLVFNLLFLWYILHDKNVEFSQQIAPWLSLGWFTILFALMTSFGRFNLGLEQALSSRYTSILGLLYISFIQIFLLYIKNTKSLRQKPYAIVTVGLIVGILGICFYDQSVRSIAAGQATKLQRIQGKMCLELVHYINLTDSEPDCIRYIFPNKNFLLGQYKFLEELGFRNFPENIIFSETASNFYGYVDSPVATETLVLAKNDQLLIQGWAIFPDKIKQPDVVLFSYNNNKSFFATASIYQSRPDISKAFKSKTYQNSGWSINLPLNFLPIGDNRITAWIYDQDAQKFIRLSGESRIIIGD